MNHVITLFTSIPLLKIYSVETAVLLGAFCKRFPWNMMSKSSKLTSKQSIFVRAWGSYSAVLLKYLISFTYLTRILNVMTWRHSESTSLAMQNSIFNPPALTSPSYHTMEIVSTITCNIFQLSSRTEA